MLWCVCISVMYAWMSGVFVCMYVCMYVRALVMVRIYGSYVCMYACMYVCVLCVLGMCVCM